MESLDKKLRNRTMSDLKESTKKIQEKYMDMVMMKHTKRSFKDGDHTGRGGSKAEKTTTKESSNRRRRSRSSRWGEIMKKPEILQRIIEQGRFSVYNIMKLSCVNRVWQSVCLQFLFKKFTMFDLGVMDRVGLEMNEKLMFNRLLLLALNNNQSMIELTTKTTTATDIKPASSSLIFPYFTRLHPDFILQIAKSSPWLKRVKIPVLHSSIPIRTLLQALEYWTELEEFEIMNFRRQPIDHTNVIISKLASNCKKLKRLTYIYGRTSTQTARLITNEGLPKLEYLDLRFSELRLEDLWKIVNAHHKNHNDHLLELNISHCMMTCDVIKHNHRQEYLKKIFLEEMATFSSVRFVCCESTTCNCHKS